MAMEPFRETVTGLREVNVQVEPVNADAERDGLTRSDLQDEVESRLRAAGFAVLSMPMLFASALGTPVLHLDVMTLRLDGRYAYSVRLELWQGVRLVRDPALQALAVTWFAPQLIGTVSPDSVVEIRRAVHSAVDEFVQDCLAVKPFP